jgi:glycerophosphoryl diester phosphodiesterase
MSSSSTRMNGRPAVSAHRGGSDLAAPATWEAYRDAVESGAEYVEFDIRRTKDGAFVVYHDPRVNHSGPLLATLTHSEANDLAGYELPVVGEVMELAAAGRMTGHLDLKETGDEREIVGLALDIFGVDGFVATTLEDASIAVIARHFPNVRTVLSVGRNRREIPLSRFAAVRRSEFFPLRRVRECGATGLAIHQRMARATVLRQCAAQGLFAMVWTVNEDEGLRHFIGDGRVDVLITDRPRRALALRDAGHEGHGPRPVG